VRGLRNIHFGISPGRAVQIGLLPLVVTYALLPPSWASRLDVPCLWTALLGVACPGCGLKSALSCLVRGEFTKGLEINPLAPLVLALLAYLFIESIFKARKESVAWRN